MNERFGRWYVKHADDEGYEIFETNDAGTPDSLTGWASSPDGARVIAQRHFIESLEKECDTLKQVNTRLALRVDNLEHDFGVLAFHGLYLDKDALEDLRAPDVSNDVVVILQNARADMHMRQRDLNQAQKVIMDGIASLPPAPIEIHMSPDDVEKFKQTFEAMKTKKAWTPQIVPVYALSVQADWALHVLELIATHKEHDYVFHVTDDTPALEYQPGCQEERIRAVAKHALNRTDRRD